MLPLSVFSASAAALLHTAARGLVPATAPPRTRLVALSSVPRLCVLDLDECVWSPEMYTLSHMPSRPLIGDLNGRGEGVVGVHSGGDVIRIYPGALQAMQEVADGLHGEMRMAVASSADTPLAERIGRAAMELLEVLPGLTMADLLRRGCEDGRNLQIGRQPPLSSDKSRTHFPILRDACGVAYEEMLFFDDSARRSREGGRRHTAHATHASRRSPAPKVWSDHCGLVAANCPGVVTQRTPRGMQEHEWRNGLRKFAAEAAERGASTSEPSGA